MNRHIKLTDEEAWWLFLELWDPARSLTNPDNVTGRACNPCGATEGRCSILVDPPCPRLMITRKLGLHKASPTYRPELDQEAAETA